MLNVKCIAQVGDKYKLQDATGDIVAVTYEEIKNAIKNKQIAIIEGKDIIKRGERKKRDRRMIEIGLSLGLQVDSIVDSGDSYIWLMYGGSTNTLIISDAVKKLPYLKEWDEYPWASLSGTLEVIGGSGLVSTERMFYHCKAGVIDLTKFDTKSVKDMNCMFWRCKAYEIKLSNLDTSHVEIMQSMFDSCEARHMDISKFDTSNVINMYGMFSDCKAEELDVSNFNTSKVRRMTSMFKGCKVRELDVSKFDTSHVIDMEYMFMECEADYLDISKFNLEEAYRIQCMFKDCKARRINLRGVKLGKKIDSLAYTFYGCHTYELDLSSFDTSNIVDMGGTFRNCKVKKLDISSFDTSNVIEMNSMFKNFKMPGDLDLRHFDLTHVKDSADMFTHYTSVKSLDISTWSEHNCARIISMINDIDDIYVNDKIRKWQIHLHDGFKCRIHYVHNDTDEKNGNAYGV